MENFFFFSLVRFPAWLTSTSERALAFRMLFLRDLLLVVGRRLTVTPVIDVQQHVLLDLQSGERSRRIFIFTSC